MFQKGIIASVLFTSTAAFSTFLPPNDLHLEDNLHSRAANMTQTEFLNLSNKVINYYKPIVAAKGGNLILNANWTDSTVNAAANQFGSSWYVYMYGGLARRPETTPDGYTMVVCHEVGHHLAGYPKKSGSWASSEGQSDYFAAQACARNLWENEFDINATFRASVHPTAKKGCDEAWTTENDQNLCYRVAMAGYSLADLLGTGSFDTRDRNIVSKTYTGHPAAQCRLDTYYAGGLCDVNFDDNLIPSTSAQAASTSCMMTAGYTLAARPLCWFKP